MNKYLINLGDADIENKKKLIIGFILFLFCLGCVVTGDYVYRESVFRPPEEEVVVEKAEAEEEKKEEEWIGSFWGRSGLFVKQCPLCQRRYSADELNCPYDGALLEPIGL